MQSNPRRGGVIAACVAASISAFLLIFFCIFVFVFGDDGGRGSDTGTVSKTSAGGILAFSADTYEVPANQEMDMNSYLTCEGISPEEVSWTSDSEQLVVGSRGHIVLKDYGQNCRLTAFSKKDESVRAECTIRSRTEEEDFRYRVEAINGNHIEDVTTDDGVVQVAYNEQGEQPVDDTAQEIEPGEREETYTWDKRLFYKLEEINPDSDKDGQINSYIVEKKKIPDSTQENETEYEIYRNPDTDIINKIVSIEYEDKTLKIVEYYYTDKGKVNFVYAYEDVNYTPSYATLDRDGERYFYHKDTMVTWRVVKNGKEQNYCIGKKEKKRVEKNGHSRVKLYSECGQKRKDQYDEKERNILKDAYEVLEKAKYEEGISIVSGYLYTVTDSNLETAEVRLESLKYNETLYTVSPDENGYYEISVPSRQEEYNLEFFLDGFLEETLYGVEVDVDEIYLNQENVYLSEKDEQEYPCELAFYDALNEADWGSGMAPLDNLHITVRRGVNKKDGESVFDGYVEGYVQTLQLKPGMYTVQMTKDNYMETYSSLFVSGETQNYIEIFATPELADDEYRVVLTWDAEPGDLDSHLFAPVQSGDTQDYHICYYHMSDSNGNTSLDVDDTDGYGPETTTINHVQNGQYKFYVCDYTNCSRNNEESRQMSESSATVRVYGKQGLLQTFYVPVNQNGVIWEVFEIRNGTVIPTQRYYDAIGNKTWWQSGK